MAITDHRGLGEKISELLGLSNHEVIELDKTSCELKKIITLGPELIVYGSMEDKNELGFVSLIRENPVIQN